MLNVPLSHTIGTIATTNTNTGCGRGSGGITVGGDGRREGARARPLLSGERRRYGRGGAET